MIADLSQPRRPPRRTPRLPARADAVPGRAGGRVPLPPRLRHRGWRRPSPRAGPGPGARYDSSPYQPPNLWSRTPGAVGWASVDPVACDLEQPGVLPVGNDSLPPGGAHWDGQPLRATPTHLPAPTNRARAPTAGWHGSPAASARPLLPRAVLDERVSGGNERLRPFPSQSHRQDYAGSLARRRAESQMRPGPPITRGARPRLSSCNRPDRCRPGRSLGAPPPDPADMVSLTRANSAGAEALSTDVTCWTARSAARAGNAHHVLACTR